MTARKYPIVGEKIEIIETIGHSFNVGDIVEVTDLRVAKGHVRATNGHASQVLRPSHYKLIEAPKAIKAPIKVPKAKLEKHQIIGQDKNKKILNVGIDKNLPMLLIGETGTGKTSLIREAAMERKQPWTRFSITGETTVDEFVGKYELEAGETIWRDGVLLDAMKSGKWLIADEINVALPEILFVLHSLLDDDNMVTVAQHAGEVVKPHKDFRFFATMNPTDEYAGTKELNKAFQSRFNIVLQVEYPQPAIEAKIVADKTGVDLADATKMADVAVALRKAKKEEKIFYTCSTRDLLQWGTLSSDLDPHEAFRVSVLNKSNGDSEAIMEIYKHVIGRYITVEEANAGATLSIDYFESELKKLSDEKAKFEAHKDEVRKEITEDIITKLTSKDAMEPAVVTGKAIEGTATEGVFAETPY